MQNQEQKSHSFAPIIFLCYLLPLLFYCIFSSETVGWELAGLGLFLSGVGTLCLFLFMASFEKRAPQPYTANPAPSITERPDSTEINRLQESLTQAQEQRQELVNETKMRLEEMQKLSRERNQLLAQAEKLREEMESYKQSSQEFQSTKEHMQKEYLRTIEQQRHVIEQQEQAIAQLENQVKELKYEVKTLAELSDKASPIASLPETVAPYQVQNPIASPSIEASLQLKRCIDIAQKMAGTSLFNRENSRFRELALNSYSIDLRRLFDSLRAEHSNMILLYSQKEDKLLFVNHQAKNLLGWSPEKFVQEFPQLVLDGGDEWKRALQQLPAKQEDQIHLNLKTKNGDGLNLQCHLGMISSGIFRDHVIGVLFKNES